MKKKNVGWYPITFIGGLTTSLYALVPVYVVYIDNLGLLTTSTRVFAAGGMLFVTACALVVRKKGDKLFCRYDTNKNINGFTLIELLVVISIIGILSTLILPSFISARNAAYQARAKAELRQVATALELYANDHGGYPPDANRDLPPGLEAYLAGDNWPKAPWPGSVYDWDSWSPSDLTYDPKQQVYQISIRFCPLNQPNACTFPDEPWAQNFDYYSAAYYCVSGPCRAHSTLPIDHPAYCINC